MESLILLIFVVLVIATIEITYLVHKLPRQSSLGRSKRRPIFVDTSVLIDGRIIAVAQSGFLTDPLLIPRSVIGELQYLADNSDHDKRARARHGLDIVSQLQAIPGLTVEIYQDGSRAEEGVDVRLLQLAKAQNGVVCTIDYNLNKVAQVENITVLNVNELAQQLRMAYLPGERMLLELVQKGNDSHQAVGYLKDGTMVVVEHASKFIGQSIEIEFIRSLQTAAGKMMFARPVAAPANTQAAEQPRKQQQARPAGRKNPQQPQAQGSSRTTSKPSDAGTSKTYTAKPKQRTQQKPRRSNDREASLIELVEKQGS